jgi:hypothetical protein
LWHDAAMLGRLARRRRDDVESRLLWIFGSPRSGSTWLLGLLNEHERVVPIDEPLIGEHLAPILSDRPGFHPADLTSDNFTWPRFARDVPTYFFSEGSSPTWLPPLGELLRARFGHYAGDSNIVVIKEPNGTQAADVILRALPRSRVVFLLRDGRDVVDSELASFLEGSWVSKKYPLVRGIREDQRLEFVRQSAYKWLWRTQLVEEAVTAHPGPKHVVRYEDLRHDPVPSLGALLDAIGLDLGDLEDAVSRHAFETVLARGSQEFHRSAQPGRWRESLAPEEQAVVEEVLGPKLRELGYE